MASTTDPADKYAIHAACREGQIEKVSSLLSTDPRLASRRDDDDRLPLHWATAYNHPQIIELLSHTKNFDIDAPDASGWTPLMMASNLKDNEELISLLLDRLHAGVNIKNDMGQTAIFFACSKANLDLVRALIEKGANCRVRDKRGQQAIHRAAAVGATGVVRCLVKEGGSAVNGSDEEGCTALHHAVAEGWGDTVVELLRLGAESGKRDKEGRVAMQLCPDKKVRGFVRRMAEMEGVEVEEG